MSNHIPKVIHYCWFGGNPKPELIAKCIESWRKYCPDYEIKEWNENNWDIHAFPYAEAAYSAKKWAFVSDVCRLDVLYTYGGIYMDTDVEIKASPLFEDLLLRDAFLFFENERAINTGACCGTAAANPLFAELLDVYRDRRFDPDHLGGEVNSGLNKPVFKAHLNPQWNDRRQVIGNTEILTSGMFSSFAVHYGTRTWDPALTSFSAERPAYKDRKYKRILRDPRIFSFLEKHFGDGFLLNLYSFLTYDLIECGPVYFIKRFFRKLLKKN